MSFDAIIMAGGKGTRLLPYSAVIPKPLMPLGDAPVLELLLRQLAAQGVRRVCLAVNHLRALIQAFFGNGAGFGLDIEYALEDAPLGTCGPVAQVLGRMRDDFLLLNGDLVTDLDVGALLAGHTARASAATVAVLRRTTRLDFGVVDTDAGGRVTAVREKPASEHLLSMGVYALRRDAIAPFLRPGERLDMPDLLAAMIAAGLRVDAHVAACEWFDIGRVDEYARAQAWLAAGRP